MSKKEMSELNKKIISNLEIAYQKMLDFKIYKGTKVAMSDKDGKVILVDPRELKK